MSAAFDTVGHRIMFDILHHRFDIRDDALTWTGFFRTSTKDLGCMIIVGSGMYISGDEIVDG